MKYDDAFVPDADKELVAAREIIAARILAGVGDKLAAFVVEQGSQVSSDYDIKATKEPSAEGSLPPVPQAA